MLDHDETHLHDAEMSLEELGVRRGPEGLRVETVLADIRDRERVFGIFTHYRPEIVFHGAVHQHVLVLELHPAEALATNVLGTANLADAALSADTERFVLISTDKAINPASVMGASKWLAEQVVRSLQNGHSVLCAVRFGNVLGSGGPVDRWRGVHTRHGRAGAHTGPRRAAHQALGESPWCGRTDPDHRRPARREDGRGGRRPRREAGAQQPPGDRRL